MPERELTAPRIQQGMGKFLHIHIGVVRKICSMRQGFLHSSAFHSHFTHEENNVMVVSLDWIEVKFTMRISV